MTDDTKFKVCPDPTIYHVDALYEWVFGQNKNTYPHSRVAIPEQDKKRLQRMWNKLHPPASPKPLAMSYRTLHDLYERCEDRQVPLQIKAYLGRFFVTFVMKRVAYNSSTVTGNTLKQIKKILDIQVVYKGANDQGNFDVIIHVLCTGLTFGDAPGIALYSMEQSPIRKNETLMPTEKWVANKVEDGDFHRYPTEQRGASIYEYFQGVRTHSNLILYYADNLTSLRELQDSDGLANDVRALLGLPRMFGGRRKIVRIKASDIVR